MITVYKTKTVPKTMEVVRINDIYFNKNTVGMLDQYSFFSWFDGTRLNIDL